MAKKKKRARRVPEQRPAPRPLGAFAQALPAGDLELLALHRQTLAHMASFDFARARQAAEQLLASHPTFVPAYNNAAEACFFLDEAARAVALSRRALAVDPHNAYALSNLARHLFLSGHAEEAKTTATQLRALSPTNLDDWVKVGEALAYLGDDDGVLDTVRRARQACPGAWAGEGAAILEHLAGAASYRQGNEDDARRFWRQALRLNPNFEPARANLDDLARPPEVRHAGWSYTLAHWLPQTTSQWMFKRVFTGNEGPDGVDRANRETARVLEERPDVAALIPALLDRGDPDGRFWALNIARMAGTPAMRAALRDFALSRRGPDEQRQQALSEACKADLVPERLRLWVKGRWCNVAAGKIELHDEPTYVHPPEVTELTARGQQLLQQGQARRAESVFREAVALEPDAPDLIFNLAACLMSQRRHAEGEAMMRDVHARFPDYWFGRTGVARLEVFAGRLDRAAELLAPLLSVRRMRGAEFVSLATVQIELALARGDRNEANMWSGMWGQLIPNHPHLAAMRRLIEDSPF